jgi:hypothetical protein
LSQLKLQKPPTSKVSHFTTLLETLPHELAICEGRIPFYKEHIDNRKNQIEFLAKSEKVMHSTKHALEKQTRQLDEEVKLLLASVLAKERMKKKTRIKSRDAATQTERQIYRRIVPLDKA